MSRTRINRLYGIAMRKRKCSCATTRTTGATAGQARRIRRCGWTVKIQPTPARCSATWPDCFEVSDVTRCFYIAVVTQPQHSWIWHASIISASLKCHLNIFAGSHCCWGRIRGSGAAGDASGGGPPRLSGTRAGKYSGQANTICDMNVAAILHRIIRDGERHLQIFRGMHQQVQAVSLLACALFALRCAPGTFLYGRSQPPVYALLNGRLQYPRAHGAPGRLLYAIAAAPACSNPP